MKFIVMHKLISGVLLIFIIAGGYFGYTKIFGKNNAVRYITGEAKRGTLVLSISGSGQISALSQVEIKPKTSGDVIYIKAKNGERVKAGDLILELDARDAKKAVRDAEANLDAAKLSLEKLKKPADTLSVIQAENSLAQAKELKQKTEDDLKKAYEDGFNIISNAMLDLPGIMTGIKTMMFDNTIDTRSNYGTNISWYVNQVSSINGAKDKAVLYMNDVYSAYNSARKMYEENFDAYKALSRTSPKEKIEALIFQTYETTKNIANMIKAVDNFIDFVEDDMKKHDYNIPQAVLSNQADISSYTSKTNSHLLNLLSVKRTIEDSKNAIVNADRSIAERAEYLAKLKAGADILDIQSAELVVKQKENALLDAKEKLADYFIRAPFDGIIAEIKAERGDFVSPSSVVAEIISPRKLAIISLSEVDAARIKVGQEAILTFDALPELKIKGKVVEISTIGTEVQGVVSYDVKISLEEENKEIKGGMSVNAEIIVDKKENSILVPNSAVKKDDAGNYVEVVQNYKFKESNFSQPAQIPENLIEKRYVKIGIANDEFTEILDKLNEGEIVIFKTLNQQASVSGSRGQNNPFVPRLPFGQQRR